MFSRFFIHRPVFASVLALLMVLAGAVALPVLPIEQFPEITPPTIQVTASFPGADAKTLVDTVTAPIEQAVNGVEDMIYMKSTSSNDGAMSLTISFALGTDADMAAVRVQNKVAIAEPRLPQEVRTQGVNVTKQSTSLLTVVSLISPDDKYDALYLSNYASLYVKDTLSRVPGVGGVTIFGARDFSMRLWLDPRQLASRDLTTLDVVNALREQNVQVAAGQIGAEPTPDKSGFQFTVNTAGRLTTPEQFEQIVLKVGEDQRLVRLTDVARVELGAESYASFARRNGKPAATLGIYQLPGSNAVETAEGIRKAMDELSAAFPPGLEHTITFDFTRFVTASIKEVVITLIIASLLVFLVTFVFLQDWRATLIPTIAIPVSLVATFAALLAMGYSLNMLSLFGLVLAIGIVVDDAIVVVENVARNIDETGCSGREAATRAMSEITGPVIATTLVVLAVFIPAAMLGGLTGELYRQFAVTISVATVFSSINALTLSPALCAILLRPTKQRKAWPFRLFNAGFNPMAAGYVATVRGAIRAWPISLVIFGGLLYATYFAVTTTPTGFIPPEDQGYFFVNVQLPDAAKLGRTDEVLARVEKIIAETPGVEASIGIGGFSLLTGTNATNSATAIVILQPWDDRSDPSLHSSAIVGRVMGQFMQIREAIVFAFEPPPIMGLGASGGFSYELQDRAALGTDALQDAANQLIGASMQSGEVTGLFTGFRAHVPQLYVDVDRTQAKKLNVPLESIFGTLQTHLGGSYVNDFNLFGRVYRVYAQAEGEYRQRSDDIRQLKVRSNDGNIIPLDTLVRIRDIVGPQAITRYNLYPSASITGAAVPGRSSGQAIDSMRRISAESLPAGMGYEWTGSTYQEIEAGSQAPLAFAFGLIIVFLVLAAQYESWTLPVSILLTVPVGILGAVLAIAGRGLDMNIYAQVGFVLLIAMVAKNAILIVEFAAQRRAAGEPVRDAAIEASRLRFRPILMTAMSFVFGTLPLAVATGAGAAGRVSLGTTVLGGMLAATIIGVVLVPVFYVVVQSTAECFKKPKPVDSTECEEKASA